MTSYRRSIVTMALSRVVSEIFNIEKCRDLEFGVMGHSGSLSAVSFDRLFYHFLIVFFGNFVPKTYRFSDIRLQNAVTLKTGLGVRQGHWKCHRSIERIRPSIDVL